MWHENFKQIQSMAIVVYDLHTRMDWQWNQEDRVDSQFAPGANAMGFKPDLNPERVCTQPINPVLPALAQELNPDRVWT